MSDIQRSTDTFKFDKPFEIHLVIDEKVHIIPVTEAELEFNQDVMNVVNQHTGQIEDVLEISSVQGILKFYLTSHKIIVQHKKYSWKKLRKFIDEKIRGK